MGMAKLTLTAIRKRINDENDAYLFLEELRWDGRPVCPHCGSVRTPYFLTPKNAEGRKTRTGSLSVRRVWKCADCRKQFSVLTGTIFHGTKIPVSTWLQVIVEMSSSKNGVSAREIERKYELTPKTAWFMLHRLREAMRRGPLSEMMRGTIIADETFIGGKAKNKHKNAPYVDKTPVLSLINAETGEVRSAIVPDVTGDTLRKAIAGQVDMRPSVLHSDEAHAYKVLSDEFSDHIAVNHSKGEYVRHGAGTNALESFFAQLKRSIDGTHHHVSTMHLDRYLAEFDFRYSTRKMTDAERTQTLINRAAGRRLAYKQPRFA